MGFKWTNLKSLRDSGHKFQEMSLKEEKQLYSRMISK